MGTFYKELGKNKAPWELWPRLGPITEALHLFYHNNSFDVDDNFFFFLRLLYNDHISPSDDLHVFSKQIHQFALPLITPLGPQHHSHLEGVSGIFRKVTGRFQVISWIYLGVFKRFQLSSGVFRWFTYLIAVRHYSCCSAITLKQYKTEHLCLFPFKLISPHL